GICPGRYILSARDFSKGLNGELPLEAAGADVKDLELVIGPGAKIAGRLVGENGAPLTSTAGIELRAIAPAETQQSGTAAARMLAGGAFEWPGLIGEYVVRATRLPAGLWLKAIMRGDADVTDASLRVTH